MIQTTDFSLDLTSDIQIGLHTGSLIKISCVNYPKVLSGPGSSTAYRLVTMKSTVKPNDTAIHQHAMWWMWAQTLCIGHYVGRYGESSLNPEMIPAVSWTNLVSDENQPHVNRSKIQAFQKYHCSCNPTGIWKSRHIRIIRIGVGSKVYLSGNAYLTSAALRS